MQAVPWTHRQRVADVLERVAASCDGSCGGDCLGCDAGDLLADLRTIWIKEKRWRNDDRELVALVHVAGPVIACREYRRSCPLYIVDRRQTCARCGEQLVRGTWAMFYDEGALVGRLPGRGAGTYPIHPPGRAPEPDEVECT